jgi:hypothetical protein
MVPPSGAADQLATPEFVRALLQKLTGDVVAGANGRVVREGVVRSGSVQGYEAIVEAAGGRGRYRAFPHRGRVYQVMAIGRIERAEEADLFVESFGWSD